MTTEHKRTMEAARFWREFAIMLSSGVPVLVALDIQKAEASLSELRTAIDGIAADLRNGKAMSASCSSFPELFSPSVVALVRAGEAGGVLDKVAERIADGLERGALPLSGGDEGAAGVSVAALFSAPERAAEQRVNDLVGKAFRSRASDIHLEPLEHGGQVRLRIDGVMQAPEILDQDAYDRLLSQVMLASRVDLAERRRPQNGRMRTDVDGRPIDLRACFVPTLTGYSGVIRVLDRAALTISLDQTGASPETLSALRDWARRPHGLHVIGGPVGSGKTTVLYALLGLATTSGRKVMSAEDPVEFALQGVQQVEVRNSIGLTYPLVIRNILRQDPDVIMVGEIRDAETAQLCATAALTGHLLFTQMHANAAAQVPRRFIDLGMDPWIVHQTLRGAASVRLIRMVCASCKEPDRPKAMELLSGLSDCEELLEAPYVKGAGCEKCHGSGYRGRTGIFEILPLATTIEELIARNADPQELGRAAVEAGMVTMRHDGLRKAARGITTIEEVLRVTGTE